MLKLKLIGAVLCGSVALMSAAPASAGEWSRTSAAYHTAKWYAKQAAKAALEFAVPSAQAKDHPGKVGKWAEKRSSGLERHGKVGGPKRGAC